VSGNYLLDTGVANLLALLTASAVARAASAQAIYLPVIVIGELYDGAYMMAPICTLTATTARSSSTYTMPSSSDMLTNCWRPTLKPRRWLARSARS
jgi:hypothetical protein